MIIFNNMKNLQESKRIKLNDNLDNEIKKVVDLFFKKTKRKLTKKTSLGSLKFKNDVGVDGKVEIFIDPSIKGEYYAELDSLDPDNPKTDELFIRLDPSLNKDPLTLYNSLYHEMLHVTDPRFTTHYTDKYWKEYSGDPNVPEKYFGHDAEFRTMPYEFLNALVNEFKRRKKLTSKKPESQMALVNSLSNILNYFVSGEELSNISLDILHSTWSTPEKGSNPFATSLKKMSTTYPETSSMLKKDNSMPKYFTEYLFDIKKYNQSRWNKFLSALYSTYLEISNIISQE
jgi:hypothetical protein